MSAMESGRQLMAARDRCNIVQNGHAIMSKNFCNFFQKVLAKNTGDEVYIKSIDRLGRNYDEIIEQWRFLTRVKDADIVVLDFPLLDTRNQINGITGKFIADLVLQILSYVAQVERENIHQRQMEGIKEAKNKGIQFGRPRTEIPKDFQKMVTLCKLKKISKRKAARMLNISHTTFIRWLVLYEKNND